jgi:hypothetical protein
MADTYYDADVSRHDQPLWRHLAAEDRQAMQRCAKHWFDAAVETCGDCGSRVCADCLVSVPRVGTFCGDCALTRAGIRARKRR